MWSFGLVMASRQNRNPRTGIFVRDDRRDKRALRCSKLRLRSSFQARRRQLPFTPVSRFFVYLFYIFSLYDQKQMASPSLSPIVALISCFYPHILIVITPLSLPDCSNSFLMSASLRSLECSARFQLFPCAFHALNCFHFHPVPSLPPFISPSAPLQSILSSRKRSGAK